MTTAIVKTPLEQMTDIAVKNELSPDKTQVMLQAYAGILLELDQFAPQVAAIVCQGEDDTETMERAKDGYKTLSKVLKEAEEIRKAQKADAKREADAVDGIGRVLKSVIEPMLEHLKAQRDYAKIAEEKRQAAADKAEREELEKLRLAEQQRQWAEQKRLREEADKARKEAELARAETAAVKEELVKTQVLFEELPPPQKVVETKCTCPNCGYQFNPGSGF